jgi:hypothetical protein
MVYTDSIFNTEKAIGTVNYNYHSGFLHSCMRAPCCEAIVWRRFGEHDCIRLQGQVTTRSTETLFPNKPATKRRSHITERWQVNKNGKSYSLEYTEIPNVLFTLNHWRWRQQVALFITTTQTMCDYITLTRKEWGLQPQCKSSLLRANNDLFPHCNKAPQQIPWFLLLNIVFQEWPRFPLSNNICKNDRGHIGCQVRCKQWHTHGRLHNMLFAHTRAWRTPTNHPKYIFGLNK